MSEQQAPRQDSRRGTSTLDAADGAPVEEASAHAASALTGREGDADHPAASALRLEGTAASRTGEETELATWLFRKDQEPSEFALDDLPEIVAVDENFAWIDLSSYAESDLRRLAQLLHLHRIAVHDALSHWTRPRIDPFKDHFFVSVTVPQPDLKARKVQANQLDLFVGNNFLLSAHKLPLPFVDRVLVRARQSPELVQYDSAYMLYIMLDEWLAYCESLNEQVQAEIELMEERALRNTSDAFLEDLLRFKRYMFALAQLIEQHREIFAAFLRPDFRWVSGDEVDVYFRDLESRLGRLIGTLLAARDAVNGAFDIYVSHVSHRTNQVIKVLTMVSTVVLPATLIAQLFSTDIQGLPFYHPVDFVVMLLIMLFVSSAILFSFHRRGWL